MAGIPQRTGFDADTRQALAYWTCRGFGQEEAARRAGVPQSPRLTAYFRSKAFRSDLLEAGQQELSKTIVPKALRHLDDLLTRDGVHDKVRLDAVKTALDRGGLPAMTAIRQEGEEKDMREMTPAELAALIERLEREKSDRAEDVTPREGEASTIRSTPEPDEFLS